MLLQDQGKCLQCLCEVCENFRWTKKYCLKSNVQLEIDLTIHDLLAHMLCAANELDYVLGKCTESNCGIVNFDVLESKKAETVAYTSWGKDDHNRKAVQNLEDTVEDLCKKIQDQVHMLTIHCYNAKWQWNLHFGEGEFGVM